MFIKNVSIPSFTDFTIKGGVDVLLTGSRISKVGYSLKAEGEVIDGSGSYLIPGLVNTHSHTAMTLLRGAAEDVNTADWFNKYVWIYENNLTPQAVYVGTLLGAAEMLLSGITCAADHYFYMDQACRAYLEAGMRADLAWAVFGVGDDAEKNLKTALDFSEEYRNLNPLITISLGPHSPYLCSDDFLKKMVKEADRLNMKMHIHVSEEEAQVERSLKERNITPVQVLDNSGVLRDGTVLAHAYYATDGDLKLIGEKGAGAAHCAKTYMKHGHIHNFLPRAIEAGLNLGLGTDGAASNNTMNIFEVARDAALLAKAVMKDPEVGRIEDVVPLLFSGGKVLGLGDYGEIRPGSLADLVLIKPVSPSMIPEHNFFANLLYSITDRDVETVIVDGKVIVREGKLLTVDMEALRREAVDISRRLTVTVSDRPMQQYRS
ncbi:MAG: amidohydrolase [Spirochaetota bacterium]